jgi:hypothetical protein
LHIWTSPREYLSNEHPLSQISVLLSSWQCLACNYIFFSLQWIFFLPKIVRQWCDPIEIEQCCLEENLIKVGVDTVFAWGHQSKLWRFSLHVIDFLLQEENEHFPTTVTHQARLQRFRGLAFQNTKSKASHSSQTYLLWIGGEC